MSGNIRALSSGRTALQPKVKRIYAKNQGGYHITPFTESFTVWPYGTNVPLAQDPLAKCIARGTSTLDRGL